MEKQDAFGAIVAIETLKGISSREAVPAVLAVGSSALFDKGAPPSPKKAAKNSAKDSKEPVEILFPTDSFWSC